MAHIAVVDSGLLKQQYQNKRPPQFFEIEERGQSIAVKPEKRRNAGPASILSLSPEALAILNKKRTA